MPQPYKFLGGNECTPQEVTLDVARTDSELVKVDCLYPGEGFLFNLETAQVKTPFGAQSDELSANFYLPPFDFTSPEAVPETVKVQVVFALGLEGIGIAPSFFDTVYTKVGVHHAQEANEPSEKKLSERVDKVCALVADSVNPMVEFVLEKILHTLRSSTGLIRQQGYHQSIPGERGSIGEITQTISLLSDDTLLQNMPIAVRGADRIIYFDLQARFTREQVIQILEEGNNIDDPSGSLLVRFNIPTSVFQFRGQSTCRASVGIAAVTQGFPEDVMLAGSKRLFSGSKGEYINPAVLVNASS